MDWDRFDICEAYFMVEVYYNVDGWLRERPSNQRRRESTGVQLSRMGFSASAGLCYSSLSPNGQEIFHDLIQRLKLPAWTEKDTAEEEAGMAWGVQ